MSAAQLLYIHTRPGRIRVIKAFAVSQAIAWSYLGYSVYNIYEEKKKIKRTKLSEDARAFDKITKKIGEASFTQKATYFCVGLGYVMTVGAALWGRQSIKSVHLLNRNRISITTYGLGFRERSFTIPISEVQSVNPGASASYIKLRVVGEPLPYIVDRDGTFPLPRLFHAVTAPSYTL